MKSINSPARTLSLIGFSIFVHGAVFWATAENLTLKRLSEAAQVLRDTQAPVANPAEESTAEVMPTQEVPAEETQPTKFAFKKVESFKPRIKKVKEEEIAKVLPKKEVVEEEKETTLPQKTVAIAETDANADTDADAKTEAFAQLETTPEEIKEIESQDLALEEAFSEKIRSYLGLRQVEGNQPPQYPLEARKQGFSGKVILNYFVTETGGVKDIKVAQSSGHQVLDEEAVRAISGFRFYPGQEGWTEHSVKFTLNNGSAPDLGASNSRDSF